MKLGVIGGGVIGRATARAFIEHVDEVRVFDGVKERATHTLTETLSTDLIFVCLPTPQKKDSLACDLSAVEGFFHFVQTSILGSVLEGGWCSRNFILRSTVPIGTTKAIARKYGLPNLVHSPEFLTARCSIVDAQIPSRNILGEVGYRSNVVLSNCARILRELYSRRFPGVQLFEMTSDESEATKLFLNGFFAVKVAYWNECSTLAEKLGLDWERVMEGVLSDGRVAHSHTKVPGPDGKYGFGGMCLPKDLGSLVSQMMDNGLLALVTSAAGSRNEKIDRTRGA